MVVLLQEALEDTQSMDEEYAAAFAGMSEEVAVASPDKHPGTGVSEEVAVAKPAPRPSKRGPL